jgi:hypothetical protein
MVESTFVPKPLKLLHLALGFAGLKNILHLSEYNMAGEYWYQGFMKRCLQFSLRAHEQRSVARTETFNRLPQNISATSVKRRAQKTRENNYTDTKTYFKQLKDRNNPALNRNRPNLSKQLKKSTPGLDLKNE